MEIPALTIRELALKSRPSAREVALREEREALSRVEDAYGDEVCNGLGLGPRHGANGAMESMGGLAESIANADRIAKDIVSALRAANVVPGRVHVLQRRHDGHKGQLS